MISNLWHTFVYNPLYNGLIFLADILPWADLGIIIILFTVIIKLILLPLSIKSIKTQQAVKKIAPEIDAIKKKHKNDKQQQALATMDLYKKHNIRPFSGILPVFIQIPILFALYFIFWKGGLPEIKVELLYPFVKEPELIKILFLGSINLTQKSLLLGILTGATQFLQTRLSLGAYKKETKSGKERSMKDDFMNTMKLQMRFVLPIMFGFIAYQLSAGIALYWTTSNIFHILQELYVKKVVAKNTEDALIGTQMAR